MPQYNVYVQPKKYGNLRRRRKIAVFLAFFFGFAAISAGTGWVVFYSSVFEIKDLRIVCESGGNGLNPNEACRPENEEELKNAVNLFFSQTVFLNFKKNNSLLFKTAELEKFIAKNAPKIILRNAGKNYFKRTLEINYSERKIAGIYCSVYSVRNKISSEAIRPKNETSPPSGGETDAGSSLGPDNQTSSAGKAEISEEIGPCFYVDETGTAYEEAPQSFGSLITLIKDYGNKPVQIGEQAASPETLASISRIQKLFRENLNLKILEINLNSAGKNSIEIAVSGGWNAIFPTGGIDASFSALKTILEKEIKEKQSELEYVDLRFGTKVYYKFRENK